MRQSSLRWSFYLYRLEAAGTVLRHGGVHCEVVDTVELRRALSFGDSRGRVGPRLIHLHAYAHGVTTDITSLSSHCEAASNDENVDGTVALHGRPR
jgi:hypothetical protein